MARSFLALGLVAFAVAAWAGSAPASHAPPGTTVWGYGSAFASSPLIEYDIGTDTVVSSCIPDATANGRGLAHDPVDGNLWYTRLTGFTGDGLIHKVTPPPACVSMGSIPFGDGPGGTVQDDVGALDIDPDDANLWAAGYAGAGGFFTTPQILYKVNRVTGAILKSCTVTPVGSLVANDTIAIVKLSGLPGSGKYILTDAQDPGDGFMKVLDEATCTGGGAATVVATLPVPIGSLTGVDMEGPPLIAANLTTLHSLGSYPFATSLASMPTGADIEDISLVSNRSPDCSTATASPDELWPPNHKLRTVTVGGVTDPDGDPVTITIDGVTQDEPTNGLGDGDQSPDAADGATSDSVMIRAERSGLGDGRVYHIEFTATDDRGGSCTGDVTVSVPHDRSSPAVDSAPPSFDSFLP